MLPHDQKIKMNMMVDSFWGLPGYQTNLSMYMRNLFCIMWHHVTVYTATICNYCIYSCIACILCDVYVQFVCNLDLPFRVPLEAVRRQSNGWSMGWLPCLKWRHKIQSVHQHLLCGQSCGMIWVYYKVIQIWSICIVYIGYLLPRDTFHLAEIPCTVYLCYIFVGNFAKISHEQTNRSLMKRYGILCIFSRLGLENPEDSLCRAKLLLASKRHQLLRDSNWLTWKKSLLRHLGDTKERKCIQKTW